MSVLQEQAVNLIQKLSDDNVKFLIELIQRFMNPENNQFSDENSRQAFNRLNAARSEIWQYLPPDFDPELELEAARAERYDSPY